MKRLLPPLALALALAAAPAAQPATGLSEWSLFLDPGHSRTENQGAFGYSEAENVLRVSLRLREMLVAETDIGAVFLSRTNDTEVVSLSQRTDHANSTGASFFHSVHSNAAAPDVNYVFVLWPQLANMSEPAPPYNGGRRMAEIMGPLLARGMRIPAVPGGRGAYGECEFYGAASCNTTSPKGSRNWVQRWSLMPSALSEAGFHTNPRQNQLKMNADWKRLEARAMFWSILDYHGIARPALRVVTGIVTDAESGLPLNGAVVTVGDSTYVTDTHASLFRRFTTDPNLLRNGFYYFEGFPAGPLAAAASAEGYHPFSGQVTPVTADFTFFDIRLLSTVPPVVVSTQPAAGAGAFRITDPIVLGFSRPMDRASVEAAFSISPEVGGRFRWEDGDRRLVFIPDSLAPQTAYTVTLAETARGAAGDAFDGDGDGAAGGSFTLAFTTGFPDTAPPRIVASHPAPFGRGVDLRPIVTVTYDELIAHPTIEGRVSLTPTAGGAAVPGTAVAYDVGEQSVVSFFPSGDLVPETQYRLAVEAGVEDRFLNPTTTRQQVTFTTGSRAWSVTSIDNFEGNVEDNWWAPQQSGSTTLTGIVTDSTRRSVDRDVVNLLTGSTASMRLDYGWNPAASAPLIRVYLGSGAPRAVRFDSTYTLQAYVFGDGEGNRFRFAVREPTNAAGTAGPIEASPWTTVDWRGWRLVSWNMGRDGAVPFTGNGVLEGQLLFDSIQLTYTPGRHPFGRYYVDDLRLARSTTTSAEDPSAGAPTRFRLHGGFPNPFARAVTVRFDLPAPVPVTATVYDVRGAEVARLTDGAVLPAGQHDLVWEAAGLADGVYIVRVAAGGDVESVRLVLVR